MRDSVVETAKAKINLALHVLGRRVDGYHEIDSIVAFAETGDVLTVQPRAGEGVRLSVNGPFARAVPVGEDNLICRAHAFLSEVVALPGVDVHLEKNLPVAAGIGGGSADAAAALRALQRLIPHAVSGADLNRIALRLGADVPVCLQQRSCRMRGVGEDLSSVAPLPWPGIVLVNPGVPCETAAVFTALGLAKGARHRPALSEDEPGLWRNDLAEAAIRVQPVIADVLAAMGHVSGLDVVQMSGSGATCFGLAHSLAAAQTAAATLRQAHPGWWVTASRLS